MGNTDSGSVGGNEESKDEVSWRYRKVKLSHPSSELLNLYYSLTYFQKDFPLDCVRLICDYTSKKCMYCSYPSIQYDFHLCCDSRNDNIFHCVLCSSKIKGNCGLVHANESKCKLTKIQRTQSEEMWRFLRKTSGSHNFVSEKMLRTHCIVFESSDNYEKQEFWVLEFNLLQKVDMSYQFRISFKRDLGDGKKKKKKKNLDFRIQVSPSDLTLSSSLHKGHFYFQSRKGRVSCTDINKEKKSLVDYRFIIPQNHIGDILRLASRNCGPSFSFECKSGKNMVILQRGFSRSEIARVLFVYGGEKPWKEQTYPLVGHLSLALIDRSLRRKDEGHEVNQFKDEIIIQPLIYFFGLFLEWCECEEGDGCVKVYSPNDLLDERVGSKIVKRHIFSFESKLYTYLAHQKVVEIIHQYLSLMKYKKDSPKRFSTPERNSYDFCEDIMIEVGEEYSVQRLLHEQPLFQNIAKNGEFNGTLLPISINDQAKDQLDRWGGGASKRKSFYEFDNHSDLDGFMTSMSTFLGRREMDILRCYDSTFWGRYFVLNNNQSEDETNLSSKYGPKICQDTFGRREKGDTLCPFVTKDDNFYYTYNS